MTDPSPLVPPPPPAKRLLLVTGSRALADAPESQDWAEGLLSGILASEPWDVVLSGGCKDSPDVWATALATQMHLAWVEYRLDGQRVGSDGKRHAWWKGEGRPHPHQRNQAMVDLLAKQAAGGWIVQVVALIAPSSKTRGTQVTLGMAQKASLPNIGHVCPVFTPAKTCSCGRSMVRRWTAWTCACGISEVR